MFKLTLNILISFCRQRLSRSRAVLLCSQFWKLAEKLNKTEFKWSIFKYKYNIYIFITKIDAAIRSFQQSISEKDQNVKAELQKSEFRGYINLYEPLKCGKNNEGDTFRIKSVAKPMKKQIS